MRITRCIKIGSLALVFVWAATAGAEPVAAVLGFESEGFDLETGAVVAVDPADPLGPAASGVDFRFAYHADRTPHAVLVSKGGVEVALLPGTPFDSLAAADVPSLIFSSEDTGVPFGPGDTAVLRTEGGALFKLGQALEDAGGVFFHYEPL